MSSLQEARKTLRWHPHNVFKYFQCHCWPLTKNPRDATLVSLRKFSQGCFKFAYYMILIYITEKYMKVFSPVSKTYCTIQKSLSNGVRRTIARPIKLYSVGVITYTKSLKIVMRMRSPQFCRFQCLISRDRCFVENWKMSHFLY